MENLGSKLLLKTLPSCAWWRLPVPGRQTSPGGGHAQHRVYSLSHGQVPHSVVSSHLAIGKINFQQLFVAMSRPLVWIFRREKLSSETRVVYPCCEFKYLLRCAGFSPSLPSATFMLAQWGRWLALLTVLMLPNFSFLMLAYIDSVLMSPVFGSNLSSVSSCRLAYCPSPFL